MLSLTNIYEQLITETVERDKIIKAIDDKRLITIYYDSPHDGDKPDYPKGWRRIEPYCYGINKSDNAVLRAWEVHGVSYSYPPGKDGSKGGKHDPLTFVPGWRMFRIDGIKSINETGKDTFNTPQPKYNPNDKDMKIIYRAATFGSGGTQNIGTAPQTPAPTQPTASGQQPKTTTTSTTKPTSFNSTGSKSNFGSSSKPSWFTQWGQRFKDLVNFGKNDDNKI